MLYAKLQLFWRKKVSRKKYWNDNNDIYYFTQFQVQLEWIFALWIHEQYNNSINFICESS